MTKLNHQQLKDWVDDLGTGFIAITTANIGSLSYSVIPAGTLIYMSAQVTQLGNHRVCDLLGELCVGTFIAADDPHFYRLSPLECLAATT